MEIKENLPIIIALVVAAILIAALAPSALSSLYKMDSSHYGPEYCANWKYDSNSKLIACDMNNTARDTASAAMVNLFPLMTVLGSFGVLFVIVARKLEYL